MEKVKPESNDEVLAYEPDFAIRAILGDDVDLNKVFSPEKIAACQNIINKARAEFFDGEKDNVQKISLAAASGKIENLTQIIGLARDIRGQANIFGFSFIAYLCSQMLHFSEVENLEPKKKFQIITKLAEGLVVAFTHKLTDEGGAIEKELRAMLKAVTEK